MDTAEIKKYLGGVNLEVKKVEPYGKYYRLTVEITFSDIGRISEWIEYRITGIEARFKEILDAKKLNQLAHL
jgi:hypothetical protein